MAKLLPPDKALKYQVILKLSPRDIDFLTRIMEGFDGIGMVSTVDSSLGLVVVWVTPDTRDEVLKVLEYFPRPLELIEI